jgi:hypothetical protein
MYREVEFRHMDQGEILGFRTRYVVCPRVLYTAGGWLP